MGGLAPFLLYTGTIPAANLAITAAGTVPVRPGITAPAAVPVAALAPTLRNAVLEPCTG
ncbi:hypothetical protein [Embleya sp. NPDC020630]|uniref:hypothetical protein n=1 Tax=Embleya sp. NPDC020630 TaxID=3363979 RepID=UPI00379AFA2E